MDWTPSELRAIADYMDKNPHQRCMSDGSGILSLIVTEGNNMSLFAEIKVFDLPAETAKKDIKRIH